ncbi:glycosyl hydrolase [Nonomuraea gerenzanensis]|uniref:Putative secreted hydrolase n=1 Tax=Nonomuraea gerenzanensis TaxID=93944 RepID=A0A1M4EB52_9ACTN|nr:glycosyl hydrolase [Nonomuraea gerenzanensis]UBU18344.1 ricin-type beta-trefoil lectin domain protein [Nonomuraea gerenzanensis]SBO96171.1 putative secreted hydrolase [Nonomuraea gerenzanensis]
MRTPRSLLLTLAVALATVASLATPALAFPAATRADLIGFLNRISGQYTLSGQHNREPNSDPTKYTRVAQSITGQTPGLWGGDFLFAAADVSSRQTMVNEAIRQWQGGSVVALTWHMCPPTTGPTCGWDSGGVLSHLSDSQWSQLVTNGTSLNNAYKSRLAEALPYLRQLQNAGVPVLWRPVHEMNDGWSWWGGRPGANGSRKLYQITYDYYTSQGLTNLVWVWNVKDVSMGSIGEYWPGSSYADVASLDVWAKLEPSASDYQAMLDVAGGKPISLAEVGRTPSPALLNAQPRWTWFMVWAEWLTDPAYNTNAGVQASYFGPRVYNRGEFTITAGGGATRTGKIRGLGGKCVDVAAANPANGTKVQLYTCDANGSAQAWTVGSDGTIRALGKCLDVAGGVGADGTRVQIWDCTSGNANQRWTYDSATQRLTSAATGKCLDATGQSPADGTALQIWSCTTNANQKWTLPA